MLLSAEFAENCTEEGITQAEQRDINASGDNLPDDYLLPLRVVPCSEITSPNKGPITEESLLISESDDTSPE